MNKHMETEVKKAEDRKRAEEWYEKMNRQFEEDSKTYDFSLSKEWDEDFQRAMFGDEDANKKRKKNRKMAYVAAGVAVVALAGIGYSQREVIGESLEKIFNNQSTNSTDSIVDHFGTKEEISSAETEHDRVLVYENKTLTEVYAQINDALKRPFFQVEDNLGEYKIANAVYVADFDMIMIQLDTKEGKIFLSQREIIENTVVGTKNDEGDIVVWNDNLKQNIVITKSVQDDSYTFSVKEGYVMFSFSGYVSEQKCIEIAENLSFK